MTQSVLDSHKYVPVGLPRKGTTLSVTEEGELIITGNSVSAGYLKDPEKQRKPFSKMVNNAHTIQVTKQYLKMACGLLKAALITKSNTTAIVWNLKKLKLK